MPPVTHYVVIIRLVSITLGVAEELGRHGFVCILRPR
jgi:hypothetical protein